MNTLEDQVGAGADQRALGRVYQVDILRADDNIDRSVVAEAFIHAGKFGTEDLNQLVANHNARDNVAFADEVCHECVLRLVVDLLRGTHLLDVALVHDNDGIGHGQRFFLVVGNVDEGDAELIL